MEVKVIDSKGKATSKKVTLADEIFGIEPNDHAIYLDVKQHLANKRQGTHKSKERNEVAGSTRKLKKQKGTGGVLHDEILRLGAVSGVEESLSIQVCCKNSLDCNFTISLDEI